MDNVTTAPPAPETSGPEPGEPHKDRHLIRPHRADPAMPVRSADLEPYIGLGYLSRLFKLMAVVLLILLLSEVVTGLIAQGTASIPTLLGEVSRLIVLAGLLWGSGDLALLLIDIGHDVRATRILLGRQALHEEQHVQLKRDPATFVERAPR
jgi:hypothetical protein